MDNSLTVVQEGAIKSGDKRVECEVEAIFKKKLYLAIVLEIGKLNQCNYLVWGHRPKLFQ